MCWLDMPRTRVYVDTYQNFVRLPVLSYGDMFVDPEHPLREHALVRIVPHLAESSVTECVAHEGERLERLVIFNAAPVGKLGGDLVQDVWEAERWMHGEDRRRGLE
jgi:hypothetical protein